MVVSRAVYDNVDAMFDRFLEVRSTKRRVNDCHNSSKTLSKLPELFQVKNGVVRVARRLAVQNLASHDVYIFT